MIGRKTVKCVAVLGLLLGGISVGFAQEIVNLRSYSDEQRTRIVIDTSERPDFATSVAKDKSVMTVRVRNVSNFKNAPANLKFVPQSCVKSLEKKLDEKDVRYILKLKSCDIKKYFLVAPNKDSKNFRLVFDYANAQTSNQQKSAATNTLVNGIDLSKPLSEYERDLFIEYSESSKGGFRAMTKEKATEYNRKLKELREEYKNAQQKYEERKANSSKKSSHDDEHEVVSEPLAPPVPVKAVPVNQPFVIVIDAGHGGKDPGAIGKRGVREKNVTLAISKALVNYINSNKQFRGYLTRSKDIFIDLDRRSEIARKRRADLLISIHADSVASGSSSARGASVLVISENRAIRENGKILRNNEHTKLIGGAGEVMDQSVGNPYLATAILDMSSTNSRSEGNLLANEILKYLGSFTKVRKSTPIKASLAVLKAPDIPSLLIETGYLSNNYEEIQLNQPNYQKQIAYHIYLGIKSYYEKYPAQKMKSRQESYERVKKYQGRRSIKVKKGDTLSSLAKQYGTSVKTLKSVNKINDDNLSVGQTLYLP